MYNDVCSRNITVNTLGMASKFKIFADKNQVIIYQVMLKKLNECSNKA